MKVSNSNTKNSSLILLITLISSAHATLPNAASISREAEEKQKEIPKQAVVSQAKATEVADPTDNIELELKQVKIEGVQSLNVAEMQPLVADLEEKTVTLGAVRAAAAQITERYQQAGFPLARAVIPPQKIIDGVLKIQVIEGQIAGATADNHSRLSPKFVEGYLNNAYEAGKPLQRQQSERALLLMRDLAGVGEVNYRLSEGKNAGETLLLAELQSAPLASGNVSVENYGSKSTGEYRTRANLYLNSLFGRGERISLQAMSSFKGVNNGRLGLELPLGYQGLQFNTSFSHTNYELGGAFKALDASGTANTLDYGLRYPLIRSNEKNLWLAVGGEHRHLTDKVKSTNTQTRKRINSGNISLNGSLQDNLGFGGFTQFSLQNTLGNLRILSADARALDAASAKTAGGYYKLNANLSRTQYFNQKLSLYAGLNAQWANKNLDSGEQLSLGGVDAVAAYHSNDVSVDRGVVGQLELRYMVNTYLTVSSFYEAAKGKPRVKPYLAEKNNVSLHGGGVGLYVNYKNLSVQTKVAWRSGEQTFNHDRKPRMWLKLTYSF